MEKRALRLGNWICDASNYNYEFRAGINELQYSNIFVPIPLSDRFLKAFKVEHLGDSTMFYKEFVGGIVTIEKAGDVWNLRIHSGDNKVEWSIRFVHELQNFLSDCSVEVEI